MHFISNTQSIDRRRFSRRALERVVSFYWQNDYGRSEWHLGRICDAGMGGIRVQANRTVPLHRGWQITVLCMADGGCPDNTQEPLVRILGTVAWLDSDGRYFGLSYL